MERALNLIFYINGSMLLMGGIIIALVSKNVIKMILGFVIAETGVNVLLITTGFVYKRIPPILGLMEQKNAAALSVDPLPQALVLTSIVIGIATTALFLFYALKYYRKNGTLDRDKGGYND